MTIKEVIVLTLYIVGIILFAFVTFDIVSTTKYNLVAGGLLSWLVGYTIDRFVKP